MPGCSLFDMHSGHCSIARQSRPLAKMQAKSPCRQPSRRQSLLGRRARPRTCRDFHATSARSDNLQLTGWAPLLTLSETSPVSSARVTNLRVTCEQRSGEALSYVFPYCSAASSKQSLHARRNSLNHFNCLTVLWTALHLMREDQRILISVDRTWFHFGEKASRPALAADNQRQPRGARNVPADAGDVQSLEFV